MGKFRLLLVLGAFFAACSTGPRSQIEQPFGPLTSSIKPPSKLTALTHEFAAQRSRQVSHVAYTLWFGLDSTNEEFEGRSVIHFELRPKAKDYGNRIVLDLEEGSLQSIKLNGVALNDIQKPERFDGHHVYFAFKELSPTSNRVEIAYTHPFSKDGHGLHRFKDPVDEKVYLYSNFEPYSAHRLFPCFDQPDLKATYELTVEAPKDWEVISNTLPHEVTPIDGRKSWAFPPSPSFSTYVFALHAGPYVAWKGDAEGIPIRLFSRKSLAPYIDSEEWLKVTRQGLDFFGMYFGFPYPFAKYDQIIVPDFPSGAMENVGAVTFSERFVHRTPVTKDRHRRRAEVILHEMAHMWFGDLVTMKWWNGLWLNESFATYMSSLALDKATEFKNTWQAFYSGSKLSAYWDDQMVTTHPIEVPVSDTEQAQANFDGITYGKGASSLKQLSFYLGEEDFREGLQRYFQKFAYRNTSINDFFKMLSEASGKDLTPWQRSWLQTAGLTSVEAKWECHENQVSKMEIIQAAQNRPLSPHRAQVALFHFPKKSPKNFASLSPKDIFDTTYTDASTALLGAVGRPCPDFVFPNYGDYDYAKIVLDSVSLTNISNRLSLINDALTRQMTWQSLWEGVLDGTLKAQDYAAIVLHQGANEKDTLVLSRILHTLVGSSANSETVLKFLEVEQRSKTQSEIEAFIKKHLLAAPAKSDLQLVWYQAYLSLPSSPTASTYARALLTGKQKLRGFTLDQERRWDLVKVLAKNGVQDSQELIDHELKQDQTDMGQKAAIAASTLNPNAESKAKWLSQITQTQDPSTAQETLPPAKLREAMSHFQILGQENLIQSSVDAYFDTIPKLVSTSTVEKEEYAKWFTGAMFPSLCNSTLIQKTDDFLQSHPGLPAPIVKSLRILRQKEERCIRARGLAHSFYKFNYFNTGTALNK